MGKIFICSPKDISELLLYDTGADKRRSSTKTSSSRQRFSSAPFRTAHTPGVKTVRSKFLLARKGLYIPATVAKSSNTLCPNAAGNVVLAVRLLQRKLLDAII